jgi:hypothetical protein
MAKQPPSGGGTYRVCHVPLSVLLRFRSVLSSVAGVRPHGATFVVDAHCQRVVRHGLAAAVNQCRSLGDLLDLPPSEAKAGDEVVLRTTDVERINELVAEFLYGRPDAADDASETDRLLSRDGLRQRSRA